MNVTRYTGATATFDLTYLVNHYREGVYGQKRIQLAQRLVGAILHANHPLVSDISHVSVGTVVLVHVCIPKGTTSDDLDSFRVLMENVVTACCLNRGVYENAIKFNGRFYKRYYASKYNDPGAAPDYKVNHVVFETADDVLTMVNEPQDAFKYRGSYFVLSKVPIDDALDLGELVTPGSNTSDLVDRAKCFWVSPETFARYSACFSRVEQRPERDILSRPPAEGGQPAIRFLGFCVIEDHSRTPASDDVLPNVLVELIKRNEQVDSLPNTPIRK